MRRIQSAPGYIGPVGPYSQAVVSGHLVFTAGQIPAHGSLDEQPADFPEQVRQTLRNLEAILIEAGSGFSHVIKVNAYLTDPAQLEPFNAVYRGSSAMRHRRAPRCAWHCGAYRWRSTVLPN